MQIKHWINAARPKTLPLSFSPVITGSAIAYSNGSFSLHIFVWTLLTTLFLQILSNFANDYGDFVKGTDAIDRKGPERMTQSGKISPKHMKFAMIVTTIMALLSGIYLLYSAIDSIQSFIVWFGLGIFSIIAAISYTVGKKPYGYLGLGDLFVFIFFGIIGVFGSFYLHSKVISPIVFLPATAIGLLSTAVLNINNIRDYENDIKAGKLTLVVKIGIPKAQIYHYSLIFGSVIFFIIFSLIHPVSSLQFLFLLALPFIINNCRVIAGMNEKTDFNKQLKNVSLTTFLISVLFWIGLL